MKPIAIFLLIVNITIWSTIPLLAKDIVYYETNEAGQTIIRCFNLDNRKDKLICITEYNPSNQGQLRISSNGTKLFYSSYFKDKTGAEDNQIVTLSLTGRTNPYHLRRGTHPNCLPDGRLLYGTNTGIIFVDDYIYLKYLDEINILTASPNGKNFAIYFKNNTNKRIAYYRLGNNKPLRVVKIPDRYSSLSGLDFSPDGRKLISLAYEGEKGGSVLIIDIATSKIININIMTSTYPIWSANTSFFYIQASEDNCNVLMHYDLITKKLTKITTLKCQYVNGIVLCR